MTSLDPPAIPDDGAVDDQRRRFLTTAATVMGGAGAVMGAVPFVASLQPNAKAKAIGAPVEVDISQLKPGQLLRSSWRGSPVWILRRTEADIEVLTAQNENLRDPDSNEPQQPAYAKNPHRSIKPEYLVMIGICTHLGCSPTYVPVQAGGHLDPDWKGGFFCPCHGSRFDLAGRVVKGVPAPTNLVVPPHRYLSDGRVLVGEDQEGVA
jgi:ubiquinol-cytochrome c reductase iron-sulfur subunit